MSIDADEEYERMCPKCQAEHDEADTKCCRCGSTMNRAPDFINPNFDEDRFNKLSKES